MPHGLPHAHAAERLDGEKVSAVEYTQVVVNHEVPAAAFAFPQR